MGKKMGAWNLKGQVGALTMESTSYLIYTKAYKPMSMEKNKANVLIEVGVGILCRDGHRNLAFSFSSSWDTAFLFALGFF